MLQLMMKLSDAIDFCKLTESRLLRGDFPIQKKSIGRASTITKQEETTKSAPIVRLVSAPTQTCKNKDMKAKPLEGKTALEEFTQTMKALFRVPKSAVQESRPKPRKKSTKRSS